LTEKIYGAEKEGPPILFVNGGISLPYLYVRYGFLYLKGIVITKEQMDQYLSEAINENRIGYKEGCFCRKTLV